MALNRKHSRQIVVDEETYRFKISTTRADEDGNFHLNVTVQREAGGSRLQVSGLVTRDFWLDISDPGAKMSKDYPVITPRHVRLIIERARQQGWQPETAGPVFVLELDNETLFFS
ncbi:hypothetical protein Pan153_30310 [Gimesia panareensis]|uniref:Uncharacterized protein n=1 Tax=Gimesia panareensis TaxID=2527978 RepID=A0A518FPU4_9PLAN|nr:hypothetical protein [Gimesia panareensis]QDV18374.1 hypothetical protein Pan153_30310 [Gimesia panareensis]